MELHFQGRAFLNKGWTPEYLAPARGSFERALALDPKNIEAMVGAAMVDAILGGISWMSDDRNALLSKAEATLIDVLSRAPNHAFIHVLLGAVLAAS